MTDAPTDIAPAAPVTETAPVAAQVAPAATETAHAPLSAESVDQLPTWAQKIITDARKEAGDFRVAAKSAAEKAQQDLTEKLSVALGLKPDAAADPAALTQSLTQAQATAQQAARELAIFKAAASAGADPSKLLDSNSFTTSVSGIDPADGAAVAAAIKAAVDANPSLKAARAAGASGIELGGTGEQGQITEQQLKTMTPEQIVDAQNKGLLKNLL
jgi:hypothetical protein